MYFYLFVDLFVSLFICLMMDGRDGEDGEIFLGWKDGWMHGWMDGWKDGLKRAFAVHSRTRSCQCI